MLDSVDIRILKFLEENSRVNASVIAERINMSVSAVIERIKKLENTGVIRKYTLVLDNEKINMDTSAYISVRLEHPKFNTVFTESINRLDQVTESHYIAGDYDFLLKVVTSSTAALTAKLNEIKSIPGVSRTRTSVVLSTTKEGHIALPETKE